MERLAHTSHHVATISAHARSLKTCQNNYVLHSSTTRKSLQFSTLLSSYICRTMMHQMATRGPMISYFGLSNCHYAS
jgi:hypothetical protein